MRHALLLLTVGAGMLFIRARANGDETSPGRAAYLRYCSACHGTDGKGDGIVSGAMRPKPADLTELAKRHGGKFPALHVKDVIDGRQPVAAHGSSEMPVWGEVFSEQNASAQPDALVRGKVQLLTEYLASIQVR